MCREGPEGAQPNLLSSKPADAANLGAGHNFRCFPALGSPGAATLDLYTGDLPPS